jgi:DNA-binding XRE family transcriptional regulator
MLTGMFDYVMLDTPHKSINVKELREQKNLTRRNVCSALDVSEMTVKRWENGSYKPHLPLEKVKLMLELFDCDFMTLYEAFEQTALETQQSTNDAVIREKIPAAV